MLFEFAFRGLERHSAFEKVINGFEREFWFNGVSVIVAVGFNENVELRKVEETGVFVPAFGFAHCFHVYGCNLYKVVSVLFCNDTPQLFAGFAVNGITESNLDNVQQVGFHFLVVFQENE